MSGSQDMENRLFGVFLAFLGKTPPLQPDYPLDS
jgi:hypothetical protein